MTDEKVLLCGLPAAHLHEKADAVWLAAEELVRSSSPLTEPSHVFQGTVSVAISVMLEAAKGRAGGTGMDFLVGAGSGFAQACRDMEPETRVLALNAFARGAAACWGAFDEAAAAAPPKGEQN